MYMDFSFKIDIVYNMKTPMTRLNIPKMHLKTSQIDLNTSMIDSGSSMIDFLTSEIDFLCSVIRYISNEASPVAPIPALSGTLRFSYRTGVNPKKRKEPSSPSHPNALLLTFVHLINID
jgi:hypothetical protein